MPKNENDVGTRYEKWARDHIYQYEEYMEDARQARIRNMKMLVLILPKSERVLYSQHKPSQIVYAALAPRDQNKFKPEWQPENGWVRTCAHIIRLEAGEAEVTEASFQVVFDPPIYAPSHRQGSDDWGIRLRLKPDGPDLITSEVRVHKMNHVFPAWNNRDDNYDIYPSLEHDMEVEVHVLRSIALPVSPDNLEPDWYLHESSELHKAVSFLWMRQNRAARVIQRAWRHAVSCPDHPVCQRRLMREFHELA